MSSQSPQLLASDHVDGCVFLFRLDCTLLKWCFLPPYRSLGIAHFQRSSCKQSRSRFFPAPILLRQRIRFGNESETTSLIVAEHKTNTGVAHESTHTAGFGRTLPEWDGGRLSIAHHIITVQAIGQWL
jgi:hypothetical protein